LIIYLNGNELFIKANNINGDNYFKLRDISKDFNFGVDCDGVNNVIITGPAKSYDEPKLMLKM